MAQGGYSVVSGCTKGRFCAAGPGERVFLWCHPSRNLKVHLIVDNHAPHKHAKVRRWLAGRHGFHAHYTPTYASWLNQVEIWFNIITQRAIRRGTFRSVGDLVAKIDDFVQQYNRRCRPFVWTAMVDPDPGQDRATL
jgi:hypothetical protein